MTSPAFSFYAKDWLAATLTWPLDARGAYVTLLAYQWDNGAVPGELAELARLLGVSVSKARAIWAIINLKFACHVDNTFQNLRLEEEREKQQARRAALSDNGAKGGRPPKKPKRNQKVKPTESYSFPKQKANGNQNESLSSSSSFAEVPPPNPPPAGGVRVRREHRDQAKAILRSRLGYCEHEPACVNEVACAEAIALELAQKAIA